MLVTATHYCCTLLLQCLNVQQCLTTCYGVLTATAAVHTSMISVQHTGNM
jgi:hypothetical protein